MDMSGVECDTVDEIEQLLDRFDCDDMYGRRESKKEARAEQVFEDLYKVGELALSWKLLILTVFCNDDMKMPFA